jgi:hypothetical protein
MEQSEAEFAFEPPNPRAQRRLTDVLAADQVADLAPDEDERGRHERLERDRAAGPR